MIEYSGFMCFSTTLADPQPSTGLNVPVTRPRLQVQSGSGSGSSYRGGTGEVVIRMTGAGEQDNSAGLGSIFSMASSSSSHSQVGEDRSGDLVSDFTEMPPLEDVTPEIRRLMDIDIPLEDLNDGFEGILVGSNFQRLEIQRMLKWLERILPFLMLLLIVFIYQHLQGFFVTICISAVMFMSNEIVKKQTALKGDRKVSVLFGIFLAFMLYVICIYWWYRNDDLLYPLAIFPVKATPPFWHAIFIILANDILVRQATMAFKCLLLIYYKNGRGHHFYQQGKILTLVEHTLLLYRAFLPTPIWYRFFLNMDNGSLFSALTTGLYLIIKLRSVVGKVRCFIYALKALSTWEVSYGVYATMEQVNAIGDLCAICHGQMHAPILLRCEHMFCEECVSEWFERARTCPLCRAYVIPADLRTFGDGSTSLLFQLI